MKDTTDTLDIVTSLDVLNMEYMADFIPNAREWYTSNQVEEIEEYIKQVVESLTVAKESVTVTVTNVGEPKPVRAAAAARAAIDQLYTTKEPK